MHIVFLGSAVPAQESLLGLLLSPLNAVHSMWKLAHARMQVDVDISIDVKRTAVCHRIDRGSKFHQSGAG
ncbi:MAG: hypothetical protein ACOYBT_01125 [Polynucleobacter sp.]